MLSNQTFAASQDSRTQRAQQIIAANAVRCAEPHTGLYFVRSQSNPHQDYTIRRHGETCDCVDFQRHPHFACKHILAVKLFEGALR